MRSEILGELRGRVALGLDAALDRVIDWRYRAALRRGEVDAEGSREAATEALQVRRERASTETAGASTRLILAEDVLVGEDLPSDADKARVPVGCVLPGDDEPAEDGVSTVNRTLDVVIGVSVPRHVGAVPAGKDPDVWFVAEEVLAAVLESVESDRLLGGRLALPMDRREIGSVVREAGGAAVGVTVTYALTYTLPGTDAGSPAGWP